MRVLLCLSAFLILKCMGQKFELPKMKIRHRIYEKWVSPWTHRETSRQSAPLGTKDLRAVCGVPNGGRIINGAEASPHELPWVVALFGENGGFCTASLISDQWVLTAAHCADENASFDVLLGSHDIFAQEPDRLEIRTAEKFVHPNWSRTTLTGDIALIRLPRPVDISGGKIRPVCLQNPSDPRNFVGAIVQLAGWGRASDDINESGPSALQKTQATVIENQICRRTFPRFVNEDVMCTNTGPCLGDSGSAMSVIGNDGRWIQIGVTSFVSNAGCAFGHPNGYTRLRRYLPWISAITGLVF